MVVLNRHSVRVSLILTADMRRALWETASVWGESENFAIDSSLEINSHHAHWHARPVGELGAQA